MKKPIVRRIVLAVVAVVLIVVIVVANYLINYYSLILHRVFAGDTATSGSDSDESQGALADADLVVQEAAAESMVLLKNDDNFLPIANLEKVNLFGWGSTDYGFLLTGGGSGGTSITDEKTIKVDLTDAFTAAGIEYNTDLTEAYNNFSTFDADWRSNGSTGANVAESLLNPDASFYTDSLMSSAYSYSNTAVVTLSRWGAENGGSQELVNIGSYRNGTFLELTSQERAMFDALENFNFNVIVLLNTCNNMELGFLEEYSCIKSCIYVGIPGQSGASVIPDIITGEINPSGRTSDTLAYDYQTYNPTYVNTYADNNNLTYQEGIYFGYKWYETADAEGFFDDVSNEYGSGYDAVVQYPFGYGLSYTTFSWEIISWPEDSTLTADGEYAVTVEVTNTGDVAGKDVVQLYGHAPYVENGIEKAERVLLDFAKTPTLYPAAEADADHPNSCRLTLTFSAYDLASYDDYDKNGNGFTGYELDEGTYEIYVMTNAHDVNDELTHEMTLAANIQYATDPDTGAEVGNLFTGDDAYADCPIDGGVTYLSRSSDFANYPETKATVNAPNASSAANYVYDGYDDMDVSSYQYDVNTGLFLVQVENSDGENVTYTRATLEMLSGEDTSVTLSVNTTVLELLADYDSTDIWNIFLDQMTETDVCSLIGMGGFQTIAVYSIGKPRATDKDGPAGFNNNVTNPGQPTEYTLFPSEALLGCSWNTEIAYEIGVAQAMIGKEYGINGWYGPGVNLHRSVYNSRNYEYYSEDSLLSGKLAAETITGAKENNLYCYVKHFAVSEAGQNPKNVNTWLTEQALRECYLRPFEIAVKDGGANAVMSAFNCVGAVLSGYNHALLTSILREEWGFRGSVITDWYEGSGYMSDHTRGVLAGNDLWLCGTTSQAANLDLTNPAVAYAARQSVKNIIYTYVTTNLTSTSVAVNPEAHSALVDWLWIGINVILGAGLIVCVVFFVLSFRKPKLRPADDVDVAQQEIETEQKKE